MLVTCSDGLICARVMAEDAAGFTWRACGTRDEDNTLFHPLDTAVGEEICTDAIDVKLT